MGQNDPNFLAKLKNAWDLYYKKNPKLILILCGSVSSWIEKNILSSTGYFGRVSEKITLTELSLADSNQLLLELGFKRSAMEKLTALSLTGGTPWYIEQINPAYSATDNIKRLCFLPDGILVDEYRHIFHDLFGRRSAVYEKIANFLAKQSAEYKDIATAIGYSSSGALTEYLHDLQISGYINKNMGWELSTGKETNISLYRLTDNYLRFYYRYIRPRVSKINLGEFADINLATMPSWSTIMGLQFENLVLNNRKLIQERLRIHPEDIVVSNPYYQRGTQKHPGCQIDLLIQTRLKTLFVCEIKFSTTSLDTSIIKKVQEKINRLSIPRGFSCVPVLIHANGINEEIYEAEYFFECINIVDFLA